MLELINGLFETLNDGNIRYCHWKSNVILGDALNGKTDLDVLVDRRDVSSFQETINLLDFKMARDVPGSGDCSIRHYYGMDRKTGAMVHLHVYYNLVTGGALLKNYKLPLEGMLLENSDRVGIVPVPTKAAELAILVIRKILEHGSPFETLLFYREYDAIRKEIEWLSKENIEEKAADLLGYWLPAVGSDLFLECASELKPSGSFIKRTVLAWRMRMCLTGCMRYGMIRSFLITAVRIFKRILRRLTGGKKKRTPAFGGAVIAVVGPEAVGKSTVQRASGEWLSEHFWVEMVHVGKPSCTWLTFIPNLVIPFLRRVMPGYRSSRVREDLKNAGGEKDKPVRGLRFFIFAIRSIMVAFDRLSLLRKVYRKCIKGAIVICDRYPSYAKGAMDSSQFDVSEYKSKSFSIKRYLAMMENRIYRKIPPPDIVVQLTAPVEVALSRNVSRNKKAVESSEYVRKRHVESVNQVYTTENLYKIDTGESFDETLLKVKNAIWECL